jgi:ribosomal protein RSM22 (predicted rRNA methylase)
MLRDGKAWCHFKQRFEKTKIQIRLKKDKTINFGDEKFSFLVLKKSDRDVDLERARASSDRVSLASSWDLFAAHGRC